MQVVNNSEGARWEEGGCLSLAVTWVLLPRLHFRRAGASVRSVGRMEGLAGEHSGAPVRSGDWGA